MGVLTLYVRAAECYPLYLLVINPVANILSYALLRCGALTDRPLHYHQTKDGQNSLFRVRKERCCT